MSSVEKQIIELINLVNANHNVDLTEIDSDLRILLETYINENKGKL